MKKTAIIGASGFVGSYLLKSYRDGFSGTIGTSFSNPGEGLVHFDIRNPVISSLNLQDNGIEEVIITSANPNIAFCRDHREEAYDVNVRGMLKLIESLAKKSIKPIFLSTDYVFEGTNAPYTDNSSTNPTTEYGRQKEEVEKEIPNITSNYLVLRLSKIFGVKKGDGTLIDDMAGSLAAGKTINVAQDQFFCPTQVEDLVSAIITVQDKGSTGIYNVCNPESWSRHEIALKLLEYMQASASLVNPISLHSIKSMSDRPLNTSMKPEKLISETSFKFTRVEDSIKRIAELYK